MVVKDVLQQIGLNYSTIELGQIELPENPSKKKYQQLKRSLSEFGLELLDDKKSILVEKIKNIIIEMVHYMDEPVKENFSDYLSKKMGYEYNYLSNVFSEEHGMTIQHFTILHKIERAKELIQYDELNLTEIAFRLNYSSVAHLSNQFKKITGVTPTIFKQLKVKRLSSLENL